MDTKIKCLLLDDELPGLSFLKLICQEIPNLEVVKAFNNPELFLQEYPKLDFDLCILDIEMPFMNGLEIARQLDGKPVIFTTAYKEYALDAFEVNALDYIQKPVQKERLVKAVEKAAKFLGKLSEDKSKQSFSVNTTKGKSIILFHELVYITISEIDSRDKIAFMRNGDKITLKNISFEKLITALPIDKFCRINKKDVIALDFVEHFTQDEIQLSGINSKLSLGDVYRYEFIRKVN